MKTPSFQRKVFPNGFTLLFEQRKLPIVSVALSVRHGGMHESVEEKGISHFIEHMLYKGTPSRNAQQIALEIERNGGDLNGFTAEPMTAFWCKMPSQHLSLALDVLSDMFLHPLFDAKELEKERQVIYEEMKMRKDSPRVYVFDKIQRLLYGDPLGMDLIGTPETLGKIDRETMLAKFRDVYVPSNMILCVVGDAQFSELVSFVENTFSEMPAGKPVPDFPIALAHDKLTETRSGIDQANLVVAYHVSTLAQKNDRRNVYAAKVLSTLMAEGMSSRLFQEIREKRNLAYAVRGESVIGKDFAYNLVYAGTTKAHVSQVKELILSEFSKIARDLSEEELASVKEQLIGQWQLSMEDSQAEMVQLLSAEIDGCVEEYYAFDTWVRKVELQDVISLARSIVDGGEDAYSFFSLVPA